MIHISTLQSNLAEMYVAMHSMNANSNFIPVRVISRESGHYKLCSETSWLAWIDRFFGPKQSEELLKIALKDTIENLFKQCAYEALNHYTSRMAHSVKLISSAVKLKNEAEDERIVQERFKNHLLKAFSFNSQEDFQQVPKLVNAFSENLKSQVSSSLIEVSTTKIADFNQAARSFWQLCVDDSSKQLTTFLKKISPEALIFNKSFFSSFTRAADFLNLEAILEQEVPLQLLMRTLHNESSADEQNQLKIWIQKLNQNKTKIPVKEFDGFLKEIISLFHIVGYSTKVEDLVLLLDELGCELVTRENREFTANRDNLETGDIFFCNDVSFTLGKELKGKVIRNKHRIFEVVENPHWLIRIGSNQFDLKIETAKMQKDKWHWGVHFAEIQEIGGKGGQKLPGLDENGFCAIIEKLRDLLSETEWKSKERIITKAEEKKLMALASHLYCMQRWNAMPENLSPASLFFDENGILKTTRLLKKIPFIYNKIEEFCILVAKGNALILRFLMRVSGLFRHPIAEFYRDSVSYTLETGSTDLIARAYPKGYYNSVYDKHVENLCKEAIELRETCFLTVVAELREKKKYKYNHNDPEDEELKTKVCKKLAEFYRISSTPGVLEESLIAEVAKSFISSTKGEKQKSDETYFQSRFELMIKYNKTMIHGN